MMKLFFSYGHDAHAWLVNRLADDLRAEGHEVWLDADKIRPGDDWRRAILDGEMANKQVLAFLSRHSVRESSVCLDEIAIALHLLGGQIIPILLEPESEVQPPVSVTHVQWLDLSGWPEERAKGEAEFAAWYATQLQAIRSILADPQRAAFAGEIERLHGLLLPPEPSKRGHQARRIGALLEGFVGRQWLMERVEAWRTQQPDSTLLWLAGEGGMGKSAFAAHLAHYGRGSVVALNLSEYNDGATREPGLVIRALAYQLATREPSYRRNLLAVLERGPMQGTPSELFRRLILEPLGPSIDGRRSHDPFLIVLDGLDETMRGNQCELAEILAECHARLPRWINLLVTSRDIPAIRNQLKDFSPQDLRFDAAANRADLEIYARGWLGGLGLAGAALERAVGQVTVAAAGNMLYLTLLKRGVAEGRLALDDSQGLPPGLSSIYTRWLRRVFPTPRPGETPPYPILPDYERDFLPLLGLLLSAGRAVPEATLREALGLDVRGLAKRLQPMAVLLSQGTAGWAPFHKSLRDWLLDPDAAGADFVVDPGEGQARLRDWLWRHFAARAASGGAGDDFLLAEFPRQMEREMPALAARVAAAGGWWPAYDAAARIAAGFAAEYRADAALAWWDAASALAEAGGPEVAALNEAYVAAVAAGDLLLRVIGQVDIASKQFRRAQALCERLRKVEPDNAEWQWALSGSHNRIGDVLRAQGDLAGALREYRQGMAISTNLAEGDPGNTQWQSDLAVSHDRIGDVLLAQGDLAGAMREYRELKAIGTRLVERDPSNTKWQSDLTFGHIKIGDVLRAQGDLAGALREYRQGMAINTNLAERDPGDTRWQRDLSGIHGRIGVVLVAQGDLAGALHAYREGMTISTRLAERDPGNAQWQLDLTFRHNGIGDVLVAQGDLAGALRAFQQGMALRTNLAERDPGNSEWQRDLTVSHDRIGDVLRAQGDLAGALRAFQQGMAIRTNLGELDPGNSEWQRDLTLSHNRIGDVLRAQGDLAGALREYRQGMAISTNLAERDPDNPQWQRDLAVSHDRIGNVLRVQGDLAGAMREYRELMAISTRLAERDPGNSEWQRDLAVSYARIGDVLRVQGDLAGAERELQQGMALHTDLAERDPGNSEWQRDLASSHDRIGDVLWAQGDLAGAERELQQGMALRTDLAERDAGNTQWHCDLAISHNKIGDVLWAQGDLAGAELAFQQAMAISTNLAERDPGNTEWQCDLAISHERIGDVLVAQGDLAGGLRAYREAMAIRTNLAEHDPGNNEWQRYVFVSHWKLGDIHLRRAAAAEARASAEAALLIARDRRTRFPDQPRTAGDLSAAEDLMRRVAEAP